MDSDDELLHRLRKGDPETIDALIRAYSDRVHRLAYGITRNHADVDEVSQEVFLRVIRAHKSFRGQASLSTWIYRITVNVALNKRRATLPAAEAAIEDELPAHLPDGHRAGPREWLLADWSRTPEDVLLSREVRAVLSQAIDDLPPHYRTVLVLKDVDGLSNDVISDIVGDTVGSVKSRLHRARMIVRERLTKHFHTE